MNFAKLGSLLLVAAVVIGCSRSGRVSSSGNESVPASGQPVFTNAWSEYPSWSVLGVADLQKVIDGREGWLGPIEQKWDVDIVLKEADYDTCITLYGNNTVDSACLTILDSISPSASRQSVVVGPTSTSAGADACVVVGIDNIEQLKGKVTRGLDKSVSRYAFVRNIELKGLDPKDYPFSNMDPAAAAQALQTNQPEVQSVMIWQPFVGQTLKTRDGSKVLFDSSTIPNEIIDSIVVGADVLKKPGGENFACALLDAYYTVNKFLLDPKTHNETLVALGSKFSSLTAEEMGQIVALEPNQQGQRCQFYNTPDKGLALIGDNKFRSETIPKVLEFCKSYGIVEGAVPANQIGFNDGNALLNITDKYIRLVESKQ